MALFEVTSDESEVSEFEDSEDFTNFDLVKLNENERRRLERQWNALVGDSDGDEEDFEGFEPEEPRRCSLHVILFGRSWKTKEICFSFLKEMGPTRVLDGSRKAWDYFQIFYSDEVFENIVRLTNLNATIKRGRGDTAVPLVGDQDGGWSEWATWSSCTAKCDGGLRWRSRNCDNPEPLGRGKNCEEHTLEGQECNSHPCKGIWSCWGEWSPCSASCGVQSVTTRTRYCQSLPPGKFFTIPCHGNNSETLACQQIHCSGLAIASPLRLSNTGNYTLTNMLISGLVCFLVGGSLSLILSTYITRFRTAMRKVKADQEQKEENEDDGGETFGSKSGQQSLVSLHSMDIFRSKVYAIDIATEEHMNKKDVNMLDRSCMLRSFSMKDL